MSDKLTSADLPPALATDLQHYGAMLKAFLPPTLSVALGVGHGGRTQMIAVLYDGEVVGEFTFGWTPSNKPLPKPKIVGIEGNALETKPIGIWTMSLDRAAMLAIAMLFNGWKPDGPR